MAVLAGRPLVQSPGTVLVLPRRFAAHCHSRPRLTGLLLSSPGGHPWCSARALLCPALLLPNPCLEAAPFVELGLQPAAGNVYTAAVTENPFTFCRASRCLRVAGLCVACVGSTFPSGGVYLGLGEEPGTAAGEAGRRQGCSSAPSWKWLLSFIDACCNLANPRQ